VPKVLYEAIVTIVGEIDMMKRISKSINEDNKRTYADMRNNIETNDHTATTSLEKIQGELDNKTDRILDRVSKMNNENHTAGAKVSKMI